MNVVRFSSIAVTHPRVLGLIDDADQREGDANKESQLDADQSRGRHGNQPNRGIVTAGSPLSGDVLELPECPAKADNDDAGQNALLESVEKRREEEQDEQDDQGADQT